MGSQAYSPLRQARHETLHIRGLDLHLAHWGPVPDAGEAPLLLLHGWLDAGGTFQFLVDSLPEDWSIAALDWRGFGLSQWASDGYYFHDYIADLDAILDRMAPSAPVRVLGHSLGGNVISAYAGLRPDRVRCVVNLEGFGQARTTPKQTPARMREWLDQIKRPTIPRGYDSIDQLISVLRFRYPRFSPETAAFVAQIWSVDDANGRLRLAADPRHHRVSPLVYRREDAEATWEEIRAPMLMLVGEESDYLKRLGDDGSSECLRRVFPGIELASVSGAGHMLHIEKPREVAALVAAFLHSN